MMRTLPCLLALTLLSLPAPSQGSSSGVDAAIAACIESYLTGNCDPAQLAACIRAELNGANYDGVVTLGGAQWRVVVAGAGGDAGVNANFDGGVIALGGNGANGTDGGDATATNTGSGMAIAVGGDGGSTTTSGQNAGNGGNANAHSTAGRGAAVGGRGGSAQDGGGNGGNATAETDSVSDDICSRGGDGGDPSNNNKAGGKGGNATGITPRGRGTGKGATGSSGNPGTHGGGGKAARTDTGGVKVTPGAPLANS